MRYEYPRRDVACYVSATCKIMEVSFGGWTVHSVVLKTAKIPRCGDASTCLHISWSMFAKSKT